jgi:hypothetical protein
MKLISDFGLYLLGAFTLILLSLFNVLPVDYLGGFVIAGFIGGLLFARLNAWRQGEKMFKAEISSEKLGAASPSLPLEPEREAVVPRVKSSRKEQ